MKLTFLGLGVMGYPMAGHLQKAGHDVCVYNRTTAKAQAWVAEYGGRYAATPTEAVIGAEIIMLCVGNDNDVRQMITNKGGILASLSSGTIIVDHTTTSSNLAKEIGAAAQAKNVHFLDAPVSGGQNGAEAGQVVVMIGGETVAVEKARPVLDAYSKSIVHMGEVGAGQSTKMVNQLLIVGALQGISEGFALAKASGLDLNAVIDAIGGGGAGGWQLAMRGENIVNDKFDYGFAVEWMRKDLGFCLNAAKEYGITLPNAEWADECYEKLEQKGHSRSDTSVLVKQYE
jgi:3-hydroxyisobutyrate dehydrogenase